jgi:hypothetical protein
MTNDKRKGETITPEKMRAQLNDAQREALAELELLGWSLKFVRLPMFQDPVPVIMSKKSSQIGQLDPDGKIVIDMNQEIRDETCKPEQASTVATSPNATASGPTTAAAQKRSYAEKRQGESSVPKDLEAHLNTAQITALRQIQPFGWELTFVRRPMFLEPVAVITNTDGLRVGTLEADGRIDLQQNFRMREEDATATEKEQADAKEKFGPGGTNKLVS